MPPPPPTPLTGLLKQASRSFYLTLRILPRPVRPQIGFAYLLARASDTIADTQIVPVAERLQLLHTFGEYIQGQLPSFPSLHSLSLQQGSQAERTLLAQLHLILPSILQFTPPDQNRIRSVLSTIISGQKLDLQRFGSGSPDHILALETEADLDDYTYRVAGCVGEFWTSICRAHLFPEASLEDALLLQRGIRFGKGLQLVNVLRDLPGDLRQGRCYLPAQQLAPLNLAPADLLLPDNLTQLRPLYDLWLDRAHDHLAAGWDYTNMIPRRHKRLRLACAWPILIARETLALLRTGPVLQPRPRLKISRGQVRHLILRSLWSYPRPAAWNRLFPHPRPQ